MMTDGGEVVVVTGGCGFVGQHVIKHVMEQEIFPVKEVRIFDISPQFLWVDELEVKDSSISLEHVCGDLTQSKDISKACEGATMVIHTAGKVDVTACPDVQALNLVNITGTKNVVKACVDNDIGVLVFTSTVDVVVGSEPIINGTESTVGIPSSHHFGPYAKTKYEAEKIILQANNQTLANDRKLKTCSLRIAPVYGEGDPNYSKEMKNAKKRGKMMRVSRESSKLQHVYAGNVGYAHVLAADMLRKPKCVSGHAYFITDETPVCSFNDFLSPFIESLGAQTYSFLIPYWFLYTLAFITEFAAWMLKPLKLFRPVFTRRVVWYVNSVFYFNSDLAKMELGYEPLYSYNKSLYRSMKFYRRYTSSP